ncbi:MAG: helix-turn-helix transcriptional regulator [Rhodospirillales bacterium]|nr:helix-turn-helix transcriptional regulator [Rhodospirillales bacterium]
MTAPEDTTSKPLRTVADGTSRSASLDDGRLNVRWHHARPHLDVSDSVTAAHTFVLRPTFVKGREALNSDRVRDRIWRANSFAFLPKGTTYNHATEIASDWIAVSVSKDLVREAAGEMNGTSPLPDEAFVTDASTGAIMLANTIRAALAGDAVPDPLGLEQDLMDVVALWWGASPASSTPAAARIAPNRLRRVTDYVEENLSSRISLQDMADISGLSRFHFAKAFKQTTGTAPYRYVHARRIAYAGQLLRGDVPLSRIAYMAGFSSQAHFQTAYRKAMGLTPAAYRDCIG